MKNGSYILLALLSVCMLAQAGQQPNVIFVITDDHGYSDLGAYGIADDIHTPNLDDLANNGALMTQGYVTAPQCSPSRAGVVTGRYQNRFGLEENGDKPLPLGEITIAERMRDAGYATGFVGKWHLNPDRSSKQWIAANKDTTKDPVLNPELVLPYRPMSRGFTDAFEGVTYHYFTTYDLEGNDVSPARAYGNKEDFRVDIQTDAALAFIKRHSDEPFFLHLAYYAPHVPCVVTEKYFSRFPGEMAERRRWALASISAIDDGVGRIVALLKEKGIEENTVIFFFGDNGAPLKIEKKDEPFEGVQGGWNGSLNDPMVGEKGMVADGGVRVPFFVNWKGTIPAQRYEHPVISLDASATALALAGVATGEGALDGVNLMPYLTGKDLGAPHDALYWRWGGQSAIRADNWKFYELENGTRMLFDMYSDEYETKNRLREYPEVARKLAEQLKTWRDELKPANFVRPYSGAEVEWYNHYFNLQD